MRENGGDRLPAFAMNRSGHLLTALAVLLLSVAPGCNRARYRRAADRDAYSILSEKAAGPTWSVPAGFNIEPDPRARFYDPSCPTDPLLPIPAPQLHNYGLPSLVTPAPPARNLASRETSSQGGAELRDLPPPPNPKEPSPATSHYTSQQTSVVQASTIAGPVVRSAPLIGQEVLEGKQGPDPETQDAEELPAPRELLFQFGQEGNLSLPPVPAEAWQSLPGNCVMRMLEFETVRAEYERTFGQPVTESQLDPAERVNLENILEIALINSREYQTRKETLYRTALRLSLSRFDFDLKFLRSGNGTSALYNHNRSGGIEVNRLSVPTRLGITRSLYTAGTLVARVSNDIVMTFNGTNGYSPSIGSEIFIDLAQPLIQRDIQFETLTQTERDVVYAARDFVQIRKQLFRDLAAQYFNLLLTYRGIAINTQDYFSNLDGFNRSVAKYNAQQIPRFQVDQFEQNVLSSRGSLLNSCNSLEQALDRLKLRIGLPPELPLNLDLSELESLTTSDEATVIRERIRKERSVLQQVLDSDDPEVAIPAAVIPPAIKLAGQLLSLNRVNHRLGDEDEAGTHVLEILVAVLEAEDKRLAVRSNARVLEEDPNSDTKILPAQIYLRKIAVVDATLTAIQQELKILNQVQAGVAGQERPAESVDAAKSAELERLIADWRDGVQDLQLMRQETLQRSNAERFEQLPAMIERAESLLESIQRLDAQVLEKLRENNINLTEVDGQLLALSQSVVDLSGTEAYAQSTGLMSLEVDMDEAMLTALVQRLDLMNQRGDLADAWRQIKYAGDSLKSVLNLRATQSIRTRTGSKNPFDFTFDDSTTTLGLEFDTPLNRRAERNVFRLALINYNVALRNLIEAQDNVKFDIRNDIRAIALDQNQYEIAIASAALAYDRVTSTRMQLVLPGAANVSARDFLEAQQAYTRSLSSVAQQHIGYIIDRIELFLDLEQLQVDPMNFWTELRNEEYPFIPNTDFPGTSPDAYGRLPCGPWYSDALRRMEQVPPGQSAIHR